MTMIEKVARAICNIDGGSEYDWELWKSLAVAAIEAMREPTPEMINSANEMDIIHWDYSCHICGGAKFSWQLLINAALKE